MLLYTPVGQVLGTALVRLVVVLVVAAATGRLPIRALLAWREHVGKEQNPQVLTQPQETSHTQQHAKRSLQPWGE